MLAHPLSPAIQGPSLIDRIIVVFQENHTFDNYFGNYPGSDGTLGKPIRVPAVAGGPRASPPRIVRPSPR